MIIGFKQRLSTSFGYVKNARLMATETRTEPQEGHVIWALDHGKSIIQTEIGNDVQRTLDTLDSVNKEKLDEIFGYMKNSRLMITTGKIEPHEGHVNWAKNNTLDIVKQEIKNDANTVRENERFSIIHSFPLRLTVKKNLGNSRKIETTVTVSNTCRIDAITKIKTSEALRGFHGAVLVALTDDQGNILHKTNPQIYGVDGEVVGDSSRTETWSENFPCEKLEKVSNCEIVQTRVSIPTLSASLQELNRILDELVDASGKIKRIYSDWAEV